MKKTKDNEGKVGSGVKHTHLWKTVAIMMIIAFAVLIIGSAIKAYHFRSSFMRPSESQIEYAKTVAIQKLQSMGINPADYQTRTPDEMRIIPTEGVKRSVLQVSFHNKETAHTFLVDVNSGDILLHTETDVYIPLGNERNPSEPPGLFHPGKFGP
jgi:hypothetical protein